RFVFQAEDGIRDDLVSGVQTCALPIWMDPAPGGAEACFGQAEAGQGQIGRLAQVAGVILDRQPTAGGPVASGGQIALRQLELGRSEERRGGERGSARG